MAEQRQKLVFRMPFLLLARHGEWGLAPHSVLATCAVRELPVNVQEIVAQPVAMTSALLASLLPLALIALQVLETQAVALTSALLALLPLATSSWLDYMKQRMTLFPF